MSDRTPLLGISQRLPPANTQAEQALLGAILANNKAFDRVADFLLPVHFADPVHGRIYEAICRRCLTGQIADPVTLRSDFENSGILEPVGGTAYLAQLLSAMVGIINAGDYGRAIRDAWMRRQFIDIGEDLVNQSFGSDPDLEPVQIMGTAITALEQTALAGVANTEIGIAAALARVMDNMQNAQLGEVPRIYSTGIAELDEIVGGGLRPEDLFILGGRPGHGKSALAIKIFKFIARSQNFPVFVFSLEMTAADLSTRMLAQETAIPLTKIELGQVTCQQGDALLKASLALSKLKIVFDDRPRLSIQQIRLAVRRLKRIHGGPGLIVVDHMHLIQLNSATTKSGLGLVYAVGEVANQLKEIAKEEKCPVMALAQLRRSDGTADEKVPTMETLKNSGDIEAAADTIMFTHRAELHLQKTKPSRKPGESDAEFTTRQLDHQQLVQEAAGKVALLSVKCRKGYTGAIEMRFDGPTTDFLPMG
jgi:replicative DNA helicase